MLQLRFIFILTVLLVFMSGTALQAFAYYYDEDMYDINELAYGPIYCPCSIPEPDPVPEEPEVVVPKPLNYQVNAGDTLYKIAKDFNVSLSSLLALNDIADPKRLTIGQQLQIPDSEAAIPLPDGQRKTIKRVLSSTLTAYTAGIESTGKTASHPQYGITYSGSKAEEGRTIAVDPSIIPIGTTVYIDGVGIRKAEDTGSAVRGSRIDVFMDDVGQALNFGVKRNVKVYVLSAENA
ncbi:3D domain-containing protein [Paenibacillus radicis (ex Xue et al. 2023)]|uniref:3D domain-containing protein n=1 Tax=Paenibacillus radicis (ex Xue et al. 2023) TaxID=2972489 RepID=A0ABT1YS65_9BACL|nr:3D domain-containing protein [Paenibacillus radicis (ex Xue et al. 2023)]MCR8636018.1 3D domain-containing protein [Paenibacillus radicis (ex Xue et al. 2023)]